MLASGVDGDSVNLWIVVTRGLGALPPELLYERGYVRIIYEYSPLGRVASGRVGYIQN